MPKIERPEALDKAGGRICCNKNTLQILWHPVWVSNLRFPNHTSHPGSRLICMINVNYCRSWRILILVGEWWEMMMTTSSYRYNRLLTISFIREPASKLRSIPVPHASLSTLLSVFSLFSGDDVYVSEQLIKVFSRIYSHNDVNKTGLWPTAGKARDAFPLWDDLKQCISIEMMEKKPEG